MNISMAFEQLAFLFYEVKQLVNTKIWRWITVWFNPGFGVLCEYRIDRFFFLIFGKFWAILRIIIPIHIISRIFYGPSEIHYKADIGKGLRILHPVLGVVVNANAIVGENLILTGGNCIGFREKSEAGKLVIGNGVTLGANAVVLGPAIIGDRVQIGAGAVVVEDIPSDCNAVGVPAKPILPTG